MNKIPDFSDVTAEDLDISSKKLGKNDVLQEQKTLLTPEGIKIKSYYDQADIRDVNFLNTMPGEPPIIRGPYTSMYTSRPWTIRQ